MKTLCVSALVVLPMAASAHARDLPINIRAGRLLDGAGGVAENITPTADNIARAEDMILAKLEWSKLRDSERQLRDAAEILSIQGSRLDFNHIESWVAELDLGEQWLRAKDPAEASP